MFLLIGAIGFLSILMIVKSKKKKSVRIIGFIILSALTLFFVIYAILIGLYFSDQ